MKIFKNFKEVQTLKPGFSVERIFGGAMLGIAGSDFVCFYDWAAAKVPISPQSCRQHTALHGFLLMQRWQLNEMHALSLMQATTEVRCDVEVVKRRPHHVRYMPPCTWGLDASDDFNVAFDLRGLSRRDKSRAHMQCVGSDSASHPAKCRNFSSFNIG